MRPTETLADALASRVLLGDGAMGTLAQATGFRPDGPGVELAAIAPELVAALHQRYLDAGADVIQTHTFGASRLRLDRHGLGGRTRELNLAAAGVATAVRDGAGRPVWVAGSVSPAGPFRPGSTAPADDGVAPALREQVEALVAGGVDVVLLETFRDAAELAAAVRAVREVTDLPLIAQATFVDEDGTPVTESGESPADVLDRLADAGELTAVGTNCTLGPQGLLRVVRGMAGHSPLTAQPNAGLPHVVSDRRVHFAADAEHFARYVARYVAAGARLVGGCCGTTPEHTAAAWTAIRSLTADADDDAPPVPETIVIGPAPREVPDPAPRSAARGTVERWLRGETGFLVAAEVAGRGGVDEHLARARAAVDDGTPVLWVSRPRAGRYATTPAGLAVHLQDQVDADVALTVTSWDASRITVQADLLGLHALGVRTVVCETGNPPVHAEAPVRDGMWEVDAVGLLRLAAGLGRGVDADGQDLGVATPFHLGARITPGADDPAREARRAREKIHAGAEFLVSRPVYELDRVADLLAVLDDPVPVLLSVTPLVDFAHAEYVRHEVPGVVVPDAVLERMRRSPDPTRTGVEVAEELVAAAGALGGAVGGVVVRWSGAPEAAGAALRRLRAAVPVPVRRPSSRR